MGEQDASPMSNGVDFSSVFEGYKQHFNGTTTSTELAMLELLRKSHPEYRVTSCATHKCDLIGFANAGHATATLEKGENDEWYEAVRSYRSPGPRMFFAGKPGLLKDNIRFGRFKYVWNSNEFLLYEIEYSVPFKQPVKLFYILSRRSSDDIQTSAATDELLLAVGGWSTDLHKEIYVFDDGHWTKDRELYTSVSGSSWDEVILSPTMKSNLISDVQGFFDNRGLYKSLSVPWKRGIILHGVPGNGKTISIKALINAIGTRADPVPSLYVKSFDACQGQKFSIRQIFSHARIMAPCLLIFEDLDSLVTDKTRSYFLNEVDGLESNDGILMIGSTNHLDSLDPAISKRPSRFDRKYHFQIPGMQERIAYCEFWRKKVMSTGNELVHWDEGLSEVVAGLSEGFSFAYLKELFIIALLTIARGGHVDVGDGKDQNADNDAGSSTDTEAVMVEHEHEPIAETKEATNLKNITEKAPASELKEHEEAPKKKRTLPAVEIPEHLKDNQLLKVITSQLQMLLDEMDNTKEEDWPSDKPVPSGRRVPRIIRSVRAKHIDSDGE